MEHLRCEATLATDELLAACRAYCSCQWRVRATRADDDLGRVAVEWRRQEKDEGAAVDVPDVTVGPRATYVPPHLRRRAATEANASRAAKLNGTSSDIPSMPTTMPTPEHPEGLAKWLGELGLASMLPAALRWCDEQGVGFLEEVADNAQDFAEALGLSTEQRQHTIVESRRALAAVIPGQRHGEGSYGGHYYRSVEAQKTAPCALSLRALSTSILTASPSCGSSAGPSEIGLGTISEDADTNAAAPVVGVAAPKALPKSHVLTMEAVVQKFKGLSRRTRTDPGDISDSAGGVSPGACEGESTMNLRIFGPNAPLIGSIPIKEKTLSVAEVPRKELHLAEGCRSLVKQKSPTLKHSDTLGLICSSSRRDRLKDRVEHDNLRPVSIEAGQTGAVYALEAGGEKIAVFKPIAGEQFNRKSLDAGKGAVREEAVYLVDRICDSKAAVPVTSRATISVNGEENVSGSVQAFVNGALGFIEDFAMPRSLDKACEFVTIEEAEALALLDMRVFNMDRHTGNLLLLRHEKPHGLGPIDHGCCLPPWWCLSEAIFEAWQSWPQLQCEPSASGRCLARMCHEKLPQTVQAVKGVGLDDASVLTLRICTSLVAVGIGDLGIPVGRLSTLMLRDEETGFQDLSWLEGKVLSCATDAGAQCHVQENRHGEKEIVVEDEGASVNADAFVHELEALFRVELREATSWTAEAGMHSQFFDDGGADPGARRRW